MKQEPDILISRMKVKNYRSLGEVDFSMSPLTALVGLNGAGKSNLVDVFRFLSDSLRLGLDSAINKRRGINALRRWSAKGRPYDIEIEIHLQGLKWQAEFALSIGSSSGGRYRIKREYCCVETGQNETHRTNTYEIRKGEWVKKPDFTELQTVTSDIPTEEMEKLTNIPATRLFLPQAFASEFILVSVALSRIGVYNITPELLQEPQKPFNPTPLLEDGSNLSSTLRYLKQEKKIGTQSILDALPKITAGISDYSVQQVGGYLVTRLHHGKGGPAFPLAQESDGTLRILSILAALYQDPPRTLLVIEEPELNIHPGAMGVLCDLFSEASQTSQILLTTHSPDLLYQFPAESLRVAEMRDGLTWIGPLARHQREAISRKLFAPGELMRIEGLQMEESIKG